MENNYQLSRIHNYIHGLLSKEEMFELEKEALDDPFLQDALDGYRMQNGVNVQQLSLLQQRLDKQIAAKHKLKNTHFFGWQRLAIGTTAAVLFVTVCSLIYIRNFISRQVDKQTDVELMQPENAVVVQNHLDYGDAMPKVGWRAFDRYVRELKSEASGIAEVEFDIDRNGSPTNIRLVKSDNEQVGQKAIALLREGPKWDGSRGRLTFFFPE